MSSTFSPDLLASLRTARHIVVLTGAGASAESGIPTFRDALTGLWERFDPAQLATAEAFEDDPELVWGWYEWRRALVARCEPNPGHRAIARLQSLAPKVTVVTQNVDDLHERAGSDGVIHVHGRLDAPRCFDCGRAGAERLAVPADPSRLAPPRCEDCGGPIRPGVVWFGEPLPDLEWSAAETAARTCDVILVVGTSSLVYPAAGLPRLAWASGAVVAEANPDLGGLDVESHGLRGAAGEVLPALVDAAWP